MPSDTDLARLAIRDLSAQLHTWRELAYASGRNARTYLDEIKRLERTNQHLREQLRELMQVGR